MKLLIACIVSSLKDRFDQPGYGIYCKLEELLIKASCREGFKSSLDFICSFYKDDFNSNFLCAQLVTFGLDFQATYKEQTTALKPTIFDIRDYFQSLSHAQRQLLDQVCRAVQLILVMPATNATSERSFSALCRVKGYLRSTMGQQRLNNLMVLHVHRDHTDSLNLIGGGTSLSRTHPLWPACITHGYATDNLLSMCYGLTTVNLLAPALYSAIV